MTATLSELLDERSRAIAAPDAAFASNAAEQDEAPAVQDEPAPASPDTPEDTPAEDAPSEERAQNRRVEIILIDQSSAQAAVAQDDDADESDGMFMTPDVGFVFADAPAGPTGPDAGYMPSEMGPYAFEGEALFAAEEAGAPDAFGEFESGAGDLTTAADFFI